MVFILFFLTKTSNKWPTCALSASTFSVKSLRAANFGWQSDLWIHRKDLIDRWHAAFGWLSGSKKILVCPCRRHEIYGDTESALWKHRLDLQRVEFTQSQSWNEFTFVSNIALIVKDQTCFLWIHRLDSIFSMQPVVPQAAWLFCWVFKLKDTLLRTPSAIQPMDPWEGFGWQYPDRPFWVLKAQPRAERVCRARARGTKFAGDTESNLWNHRLDLHQVEFLWKHRLDLQRVRVNGPLGPVVRSAESQSQWPAWPSGKRGTRFTEDTESTLWNHKLDLQRVNGPLGPVVRSAESQSQWPAWPSGKRGTRFTEDTESTLWNHKLDLHQVEFLWKHRLDLQRVRVNGPLGPVVRSAESQSQWPAWPSGKRGTRFTEDTESTLWNHKLDLQRVNGPLGPVVRFAESQWPAWPSGKRGTRFAGDTESNLWNHRLDLQRVRVNGPLGPVVRFAESQCLLGPVVRRVTLRGAHVAGAVTVRRVFNPLKTVVFQCHKTFQSNPFHKVEDSRRMTALQKAAKQYQLHNPTEATDAPWAGESRPGPSGKATKNEGYESPDAEYFRYRTCFEVDGRTATVGRVESYYSQAFELEHGNRRVILYEGSYPRCNIVKAIIAVSYGPRGQRNNLHEPDGEVGDRNPGCGRIFRTQAAISKGGDRNAGYC
ncbi:hypothetical protein B0H13DRAFT_2432936 [Mycena leptocephala]|nr:hypothetical protein B0H13DRAFT_2432936 [Mycena leptocephala]